MGSYSLSKVLNSKRNISNVTYEYDSILRFDYNHLTSIGKKSYTIFMPSRDDYEITIDIVDKALQLNCNIIVYDNWIKITTSGKEYAIENNLRVYSYGQFLHKIDNLDKI